MDWQSNELTVSGLEFAGYLFLHQIAGLCRKLCTTISDLMNAARFSRNSVGFDLTTLFHS